MWEVSVYALGILQVYRYPAADEVRLADHWTLVKHREAASCRRVEPDGEVFGTKRASDPIWRIGAHLIVCGDCEKQAWVRDPSEVICIGCSVTSYPNDPHPARGQDCVLSDSGYHEHKRNDDGIRRCRYCGMREGFSTFDYLKQTPTSH